MAAAHVATSTPNHSKSTSLAVNRPARTPLLPSDSDDAPPRRPKACKIISSRYLSRGSSLSSSSSAIGASSMNRCPSSSPTVSRAAPVAVATPLVKRSQSDKRRSPSTPWPGTAVERDCAVGRVSSLASVRSLFVSFQGELYSMPIDKMKAEKPTLAMTVRPTSGSGGRKGTPERRRIAEMATPRASSDNLKAVMEQKRRWPDRSAMAKSVDFGNSRTLSHRSIVTDLGNSMMALDIRQSCNERNFKQDTGFKREGNCNNNGNLGSGRNRISSSDCVESDSESAPSGCISSVKESNGHVPGTLNSIGGALHGIRGIKVQAKQERRNRLDQPPSSMTALSRFSSTPKLMPAERSASDSPLSSSKGYVSCRGLASPSRGAARPASPTKLASLSLPSPMRGPSPSRVRGVSDDSVISTPSMFSFSMEARRGKMGKSRIDDAHALRLLHNQFLQWRFVNARVDYASFVQALNAERSLYNCLVKISKLRESVKAKVLQLQMLSHILKLSSVLDGQMVHLEKWASMDGDYSSSLSGATEALHASTLRLPVIGRARVSIQKLKNAIYCALEMLQAMATSICISSSKVGKVHHLMTELADVTFQERALLVQCRDILSSNAAMQINECSLRAHTLQLSEVSSIG